MEQLDPYYNALFQELAKMLGLKMYLRKESKSPTLKKKRKEKNRKKKKPEATTTTIL